MNTDKHEKTKMLKIIATQNVIQNKFKKARKNRIDHENDAMKPLALIAPLSSHIADQNPFKLNVNIQYDVNKLCDKLRRLINSPMVANEKHSTEITSIITILREHGILL